MEYFAHDWAWLLLPILLVIVQLKHKSILKKILAKENLEQLWAQLDLISDVDDRNPSYRRRENIEHFKIRLLIQISESISAAAVYLLFIAILLTFILISIG